MPLTEIDTEKNLLKKQKKANKKLKKVQDKINVLQAKLTKQTDKRTRLDAKLYKITEALDEYADDQAEQTVAPKKQAKRAS